MKNSIQRFLIICLALCLSACAGASGGASGKTQGQDYFPGGVQFYSYGVSQSKENFTNVDKAQSYYGMYTKERWWSSIKPARAPGSVNMLQIYYPLDVRWKLKDGREFILEKIDIRAIMREYFKTHDIQMPWQREGRSKEAPSDGYPSLVHEVKDDTVIIKWLVITNHTPVENRFPKKKGIPPRWKLTDEEFLVTTIKGVPTSGIDFDKWVEILK